MQNSRYTLAETTTIIAMHTPKIYYSNASELKQSQIVKTGLIAQEVEVATLDVDCDFDEVDHNIDREINACSFVSSVYQ